MAHGDEQGSTDEVKVFKHEEDDEENLGSEDINVEDNLTEDKSSLITESETKATDGSSNRENEGGSAFGPIGGRPCEPLADRYPFSYVYSPYASYNGSLSMAGKVAGLPSPGLPPFFYSPESLSQPPPAHMGIPPYQLDPKPGMVRPSMYPFTPVTSHCHYPPPLGGPELPPWPSPTGLYPSGSGAFRSPYSGLHSSLHRFSPSLLHHGLPPHLLHPDYLKHNGEHRHGTDVKPVISTPQSVSASKSQQQDHGQQISAAEKKKTHIKKPLNAFMLYMKEMRAKVVSECTLKESAAINQILGRRWHALNREEQSKYYEMARKERQLHMQMYPGWSARDNYAQSKKKKRKRDKVDGGELEAQMKKCRARYGLEQQDQWCKPCRRKKKCIRYMQNGEGGDQDGDDDDDDDDDGIDSAGNGDDAQTPNSGSTDDQATTNSPSVSMPSLASPGYSVASLLSPSSMAPSPMTPAGGSVNGGDPMSVSSTFTQPRTPVGANPRDVNNPLSVGQLTGSSPRPCPQQQQQQLAQKPPPPLVCPPPSVSVASHEPQPSTSTATSPAPARTNGQCISTPAPPPATASCVSVT